MSLSAASCQGVSTDVGAVGEVDVVVLNEEVANLRKALESRGVIEQAKGILMIRYGLDADRAFSLLKRWSQHNNIKLASIASQLTTMVGSGVQLPPDPMKTATLLADTARHV